MCGGADLKREDGHRAHLANGGDRVRDRDLGEARLVEGVLQSGERGGSGICGLGCHVSALASLTWGTALPAGSWRSEVLFTWRLVFPVVVCKVIVFH